MTSTKEGPQGMEQSREIQKGQTEDKEGREEQKLLRAALQKAREKSQRKPEMTAGEFIADLKYDQDLALEVTKDLAGVREDLRDWKIDETEEKRANNYRKVSGDLSQVIGMVPDSAPLKDLADALEAKLSKKYKESQVE